MLYYIGVKHIEHTMKNYIVPLAHAEHSGTSFPTTSDALAPERVIIGVRAFLHIVEDIVDKESTPTLPSWISLGKGAAFEKPKADVLPTGAASKYGLQDYLDKINEIVATVCVICETPSESPLVIEDRNVVPKSGAAVPAAPAATPQVSSGATAASQDPSQQSYTQYPSFYVQYPRERQVFFDLVRTCLDAMPRLFPAKLSLAKCAELASRLTLHIDPAVQQAASACLVRLAKQCHTKTVLGAFSEFVMGIEDKFCEVLAGVNADKHDCMLKIYIDLLDIWLQELYRDATIAAEHIDGREPKEIDRADIEHSCRVINGVETNALVFLCSPIAAVRGYAMDILMFAAALAMQVQKITESGRAGEPSAPIAASAAQSRVIHVIEEVGGDIISQQVARTDTKSSTVAAYEATRQQQDKYQQSASTQLLIDLAKSEDASDTRLWRRCFPDLDKLLHELCPAVVGLARTTVLARLFSCIVSFSLLLN